MERPFGALCAHLCSFCILLNIENKKPRTCPPPLLFLFISCLPPLDEKRRVFFLKVQRGSHFIFLKNEKDVVKAVRRLPKCRERVPPQKKELDLCFFSESTGTTTSLKVPQGGAAHLVHTHDARHARFVEQDLVIDANETEARQE